MTKAKNANVILIINHMARVCTSSNENELHMSNNKWLWVNFALAQMHHIMFHLNLMQSNTNTFALGITYGQSVA